MGRLASIASAFVNTYRSTPPGVAFGATPDVGRRFCTCDKCRRVALMWNYIDRDKGDRHGCKCGSLVFNTTRIPEWKAFWYVVVVGYFWRGMVRGKKHIDPRLPDRINRVTV